MKKKTLSRLLHFLKPYRFSIIGVVCFALISVSFTLAAPVFIGQAIDHIIAPGQVDFAGVAKALFYLIASILGSALFQWMLGTWNGKISSCASRDLRKIAFQKIYRLPIESIDHNSHGDFIARITTDISQIETGLLQAFTQFFTGIATIFGTLLFMLFLQPSIALIVVFLTPLSIFVAAFIVKRTHKHFTEQSVKQGELTGLINEMIANEKIVKDMGYEKEAFARFANLNQALHQCGVQAQFSASLTNPSTRFINNLVYAAVGVFGAIRALSGGLSVGQIASFLSYATQYTKPFNEITGIANELETAMASADRVFQLLDLPEENAEKGALLQSCTGNIQFQHVFFSYEKEKPLIQDFNMQAPAGAKIAIVGPTGSGKTTLVNLLMRFYDLNAGCITIDQKDILSLQKNSLRRCFGMVLQDTWLSSASIRENIAYGKPNATMEEIVQAAKAAWADEFISKLPQGYDTPVTSQECNLSEGQRQLISIARVMLIDPPMLILDEATSSIDTRTELYIQKAFDHMMKGRTSFIVAHRLSTIREADWILAIQNGNIIEQGTHDALLQKNGFYTKLYQSQFAATDD